MANRPYMPMFFKNAAKLEYLNMTQRGELLTALFEYGETGAVPETDDPMLGLCFAIFREDIDLSLERYRQTCERNREKARKRWEKEHAEEMPEDAEPCRSMPEHAETAKKKIEDEDEAEAEDEVKTEAEHEVEASIENEAEHEVEVEESKMPRQAAAVPTDERPSETKDFLLFDKASRVSDRYCRAFSLEPSPSLLTRIKRSPLSAEDIAQAIDRTADRHPRNPEAYLTVLLNQWETHGVPQALSCAPTSDVPEDEPLPQWMLDCIEQYRDA